jgi:N-acetylmuramoyl-L-alanine amidase
LAAAIQDGIRTVLTAAGRRTLAAGLLAAFVLAGVLTARPGQAQTTVTGASVRLDERVTTLTFGLSQPVTFEVFTLDNPSRLVIDLPKTNWGLAETVVAMRQGPLDRVRYGLFRPGLARIVADLNGPVTVRGTTLVNAIEGAPYRLVIDMVTPARTNAANPAPKRGTTAAGTPARPAGRPTQQQSDDAAADPTVARKPPAQRVVVLDPGHGGKDPGGIGVSGVYEKTLTLATAREVRRELIRLGLYRVVLTRNSDRFIRLRDRVAIARRVKAELFVSIHADTRATAETRGASVYTLSERASDAEAAALADRENKADLIANLNLTSAGPDVSGILINLAQRDTMNRSARFAAELVRHLEPQTRLLPRTHRFAGFAVLKAPDVPSVLIETGFLSNSADEALLRQPEHRRRLAIAIARAIDAYFAETALASLP